MRIHNLRSTSVALLIATTGVAGGAVTPTPARAHGDLPQHSVVGGASCQTTSTGTRVIDMTPHVYAHQSSNAYIAGGDGGLQRASSQRVEFWAYAYDDATGQGTWGDGIRSDTGGGVLPGEWMSKWSSSQGRWVHTGSGWDSVARHESTRRGWKFVYGFVYWGRIYDVDTGREIVAASSHWQPLGWVWCN